MTLDGTSSSFTTDLKGAFYGLDDYLAIPSFLSRPIPYEILIRQAFDTDQHPASLGASFRMVFLGRLEDSRAGVHCAGLSDHAEAVGSAYRRPLDRHHWAQHR